MSRLWSSLIEVSSSIEKKEKKAKILGLLIFVSAIGKKKTEEKFQVLKMSMMCFIYERLH